MREEKRLIFLEQSSSVPNGTVFIEKTFFGWFTIKREREKQLSYCLFFSSSYFAFTYTQEGCREVANHILNNFYFIPFFP
jgi:hypothetical protein